MVVVGDARSRNVLSPRQNVLSSVIYTYIYIYIQLFALVCVCDMLGISCTPLFFIQLDRGCLGEQLRLLSFFSCTVGVQITRPFFFSR